MPREFIRVPETWTNDLNYTIDVSSWAGIYGSGGTGSTSTQGEPVHINQEDIVDVVKYYWHGGREKEETNEIKITPIKIK